MKPAPFLYHVPDTLEEALSLANQYGYDAKLIAGGQSLVPTMNFRLAQPAVLIDLNRIQSLSYIKVDDSEEDASMKDETKSLRIGAMTRQRVIERSDIVARHTPLLHDTMPYIAHVQIRNRGTIGGSIAHADPAAELPAVARTVGARLKVQSVQGIRWIRAEDFYVALFTTELLPEEVLVEIEVPSIGERSGWSVQEVSRRQGDYAMAGATALLTLDEMGCCKEVKITYLSVGDGPVPATQAEQTLLGTEPTSDAILAAAEVAATRDVEPTSDIHASATYRRHLVKVLTKRVLEEAVSRANGK
ncbi:MAG: xanthine dehydrogenase family protein subunit M [Chloroflexota bacterium]